MTHKSIKYSKVTKYRDPHTKSLLFYCAKGSFREKASSLDKLSPGFHLYTIMSANYMELGRNLIDLKVPVSQCPKDVQNRSY